jgi:uncharacterized protein YkwD
LPRLVTRTILSIAATAAVLAAAGCGGSSNKPTAPPGGAAPSAGAGGVTLGHALVTTNNRQAAAPRKGALNRLKESIPGPGAVGKPNGPESLIAGTPDTSILSQLPQPAGLGAAQKVCGAASASPSSSNVGRVSQAILCLLNAQRTSRGLRPLKLNRKLTRAAIAHSRDMVSRRYFAHNGADGNPVSRIKRAGYIPRVGIWSIGENLAWGTGALASAAQIMTAWMNSPEHKANILTPGFKEIGIGVVPRAPTSGGAGGTFTTDFGALRLH